VDKFYPTAIIVVVTALVLVAMYAGWRARYRRQAALPPTRQVPADPGAELVSARLLYVATTTAGDPLDRIAVSGLAYPAKATVSVYEQGLALRLKGAADVFIANQDLRRVGRASWTIDRAVESGGLVVVGWTLTDDSGSRADVDSYFRVVEIEDPSIIIEAIAGRIPAASRNGAE
jgi:hypothetical protein